MKQARLRATACVIRKLWPSAKLQFGWDEKGTGHFELIFPNRAYRRASAITFSRVASDKASVTMGGFVWLPRERELAMPPFVVARTDAEGNVNYYRALEIDPAAEITEERLPAWVPTDDERFIFRYEGEYQGGTRIEWIAIVDGSAAEFVQRVPQRITLGGVEWALSSGESDGASMVLRAEHAGESRSVRVKCERSSGANCVVGVDDLIGEMRFATS